MAALETPTDKPRVLVIPQWCVDPVDPHLAEASSLDLEDLQGLSTADRARLCVAHKKINSSTYVGYSVIERSVDEVAAREEGSVGLRGADARRRGEDPRRIRNGVALLLSDAVSPAIVVDLWSAPALFLRHIEVQSPQHESLFVFRWLKYIGRRRFACAVCRALFMDMRRTRAIKIDLGSARSVSRGAFVEGKMHHEAARSVFFGATKMWWTHRDAFPPTRVDRRRLPHHSLILQQPTAVA